MAVRIRLKRLGTKGKPHQRIVVCDIRRARDGKAIEELGYYDPSKKPTFISIDKERARFWLSKGATPTEIIKSLFKKHGVI